MSGGAVLLSQHKYGVDRGFIEFGMPVCHVMACLSLLSSFLTREPQTTLHPWPLYGVTVSFRYPVFVLFSLAQDT